LLVDLSIIVREVFVVCFCFALAVTCSYVCSNSTQVYEIMHQNITCHLAKTWTWKRYCPSEGNHCR